MIEDSPGWKQYMEIWRKLKEDTITISDAGIPTYGSIYFTNKKYFTQLEPGQYWSQMPGGAYVLKEDPVGKTSKPLTIVVFPEIADWPEWKDLHDKGHTIVVMAPLQANGQPIDLVVGPHCWRMNEMTRKYIDLAISSSREERYPNTGKKPRPPSGPGPDMPPSTPAPGSAPTGQ